MKNKLLLVAFMVCLPAFMFAQSAGKIVGVVTDKSSGEALPGVNVLIDGTTYGAATDVDGFFVILNIPVGVYDVRANFIGYSDVVITGIRVSASTTTEANFEMDEASVQGQAVVVTAVKPLVEKHVTQSVALVTSEDLENIPVRGFNNVMALQNSVVVQDGNIHIRGGRNEEVGYYVDGASSVNPLSNTQAIYIIQEAVEEFQVLAGGYTAEFGGANSGIIRTEYKTGARDWHFSFNFQTDKFADGENGGDFLGTQSFGHHVGVATISGPLGTDNIRLFAAVENNDQDDRLRRFSDGFDFTRVDLNAVNPNVIAGTPDTVSFSYPDGFTPLNGFERWAVNGTLLFDYSPISFRVSGSWQDAETYQNRRPQTNFLNTRQGFFDNQSLLLSGKLTHVLSPKTFYNVSVSYYQRQLERKDNWFGGDWQSWYDGNKISELTNGEVQFRPVNQGDLNAWLPPHHYSFNGIPFARNGHPAMFTDADPSITNRVVYRNEKENYIGGAIDFVSQIGKHHEIKVGASTRRYTARKFEIEPKVMNLTEQFESGVAESVNPGIWASQGEFDGYGFDIYGNEIDDFVSFGDSVFMDAPRNPQFSAIYAQDKVEFSDLIVNFGLRWDILNTDDKRLIDPANPALDTRTNLIRPEAFEDVPTFSQISPRLGVSFPVSEKTVFYGQYGKFIQTTELNDVYYGVYGFSDQITSGGNFFTSPIGFGLDPIKTTSYEVGFRQQLGGHAAVDITGFFRNDKGQINVIQQRVPANSQISSYNRIVNGDFVTTRGLELKFNLRRINRLQGQVNYTLTKAEGTGSAETAYLGAIARNTPAPTRVSPLNFNQEHKGSIILDYRFGRNDGGPLFSQLGLNTIFSFNSGHPFTFVDFAPGGQINAYDAGVDYMIDTRTRQALEPIGSSTTPWNFLVDLRLDKTFQLLNNLDVTLYSRVTNLFNTKNTINVYQGTGNADDDGYLSRSEYSESFINANGGEEYVDLFRQINLVNGGSYYSQLALELFGQPRQIFFGLKLAY